jgi:hypothetical protein
MRIIFFRKKKAKEIILDSTKVHSHRTGLNKNRMFARVQ